MNLKIQKAITSLHLHMNVTSKAPCFMRCKKVEDKIHQATTKCHQVSCQLMILYTQTWVQIAPCASNDAII